MAIKLVGQDGTPVKYQGKEVFSSDYSGVIKSVDMMKRTLVMTGTDETKDRDGDIIRLSGWNMDNYKKNPVFLWAHNYGSVPLARAEKVTKKKEPPRMEFQIQFPTKGIYPFADMILELYEEKIINASSVGFIPMKWNPIEEDNKDGHNRVQYGREYIGQELLELSGCAVPSNPSAVQSALKGKNFGFKSDDLLKYLMGATLIPRPEKEDDIIDELDKSETEIVDETTIQVQVTEQLESPPPLTEAQKEAEESLVKILNLETGYVEALKDIPIEEEDMLGDGDILKPYPNEHACRLIDPSEFDKFARKNCFRSVANKCVDYIFGIKGDKTKLQAMRFKKDVWGADAAKSVCERVGGTFEAAKPPKSEDPPVVTDPPEDKDTMSMDMCGASDLATSADSSWDGSAAISRMRTFCGGPDKDKMDWEKYGKGFVMRDGANKESFSSYKLPFADIKGGHMLACWGGVMRAMMAVHGSRGGVNVSDADKKKAHNFLAGYYKKFDKPVPEMSSIFDVEELVVDFSEEISKIKEELIANNLVLENLGKEIKGIQDSLAKALEEIQRKPKAANGTSASILQDAFNQGRKVENSPTEKFNKESLDSLKLALLEVAKVMKRFNIS